VGNTRRVGRAPATTDGTPVQISAARHVWEEDVQTYRTDHSNLRTLVEQLYGTLYNV
jgi:hypothetical protein